MTPHDAIQTTLTPLTNVEDVQPAVDFIAEAELALLGEASHGTDEFYVSRLGRTRGSRNVPDRSLVRRHCKLGGVMAQCEVCGNNYDKSFQVLQGNTSHTFDSFECAIHLLAPTCVHCHCKIVGHGIEANGTFYCCAHCARKSGVRGVDDRV